MENNASYHLEFYRFGPENPLLAVIANDIRHSVFVEEQGVPPDIEYDEYESTCEHYLMYLDGAPIATARWRFTGHGIKLERFALRIEYRNKGLGTFLLKEVLKDVIPLGRPIYLHVLFPWVGPFTSTHRCRR
jgi:predicted GNAT family N-acyltransferase